MLNFTDVSCLSITTQEKSHPCLLISAVPTAQRPYMRQLTVTSPEQSQATVATGRMRTATHHITSYHMKWRFKHVCKKTPIHIGGLTKR